MPQSLIKVDWQEYDRLRDIEGLSLTQAAKRLGISQPTLSRRVAARAQITPNGIPHDQEHPPTNHHTESVEMEEETAASAPGAPTDLLTATLQNNVTLEEETPTALQLIEHIGEASAESSADHGAEVRAELAALKAEVDAWIEAFQHQAVQTRVVHELAQTRVYLDPDDAKPERWNLWLPRGLKRLIDSRAKAVGIALSQLVQRWLWQVLDAEEGGRDA